MLIVNSVNYEKFNLLIPYHDDDVYVNIGMHIIEGSRFENLLGIDNNMRFDKHVSILCDKASQNIHALARISKYVPNHILNIFMKSFILSQSGYCPLVWMDHSKM